MENRDKEQAAMLAESQRILTEQLVERWMNISIFPPEVIESIDEIFQGGKSYMTNKEALKEMQLLRNGAKVNQHNSTVQAFDMAIEALEKQIPKKPTHTYRRLGYIVEGCCPVCGESVSFGSCCSNNDCRQAIDWSEVE